MQQSPPLAIGTDRVTKRRRFLGLTGLAALGLGAPTAGRALADAAPAADRPTGRDIAILRFLAAAELIETDLWQQYAELAQGNPRLSARRWRPSTTTCRSTRVDVTEDELSHAEFINAYLKSIGAEPVDLDPFADRPAAAGQRACGRSAGSPT